MDTAGDGLADQPLSGKMELMNRLRGTIGRFTYHNEEEGSVFPPAADLTQRSADLLPVSPASVADGIRMLTAAEEAAGDDLLQHLFNGIAREYLC
jgi:hypothetical protein